MRRAFKYPDSEIVRDQLKYKSTNSSNNKKIAQILLKEQKKFCAYTDEFINRTDSPDIEHFDPTLKTTVDDNYNNWFLVKHQWNQEKSYKWKNYQPILHPTAEDFEERIIYLDGDYLSKSTEDIEAQNLISLLKLDDASLADKRKRYIKRKQEEIKIFGEDNKTFFSALLNEDVVGVSYPRAIKEEFGVDILAMLI
ncbi:MAG: HNH endonuclease domain-containing protein [Ginsengibacter sp.]